MKLGAWLSGMLLGSGGTKLETLGVIELTSVEGLDEAMRASGSGPVLLFKHSTTCPISASAYRRTADYLRDAGEAAPRAYLIKVIESRPVSNEIAARLGVAHQSPQAILVRGGRAVWNASHGAIDANTLKRAAAA